MFGDYNKSVEFYQAKREKNFDAIDVLFPAYILIVHAFVDNLIRTTRLRIVSTLQIGVL